MKTSVQAFPVFVRALTTTMQDTFFRGFRRGIPSCELCAICCKPMLPPVESPTRPCAYVSACVCQYVCVCVCERVCVLV